jgi:hypothetical protein
MPQAGSQILAPFVNRLVVFPDIGAIGPGLRVPRAVSEALIVRNLAGCSSKKWTQTVELPYRCPRKNRGQYGSTAVSKDLTGRQSYVGIQRLQQAIHKTPVTIHGGPARLCGAWDWQAVRLAWLRGRLKLLSPFNGRRLEFDHLAFWGL